MSIGVCSDSFGTSKVGGAAAPAGKIHYYELGTSGLTLCGVHADFQWDGSVDEAVAAAHQAGFSAWPCGPCGEQLAKVSTVRSDLPG